MSCLPRCSHHPSAALRPASGTPLFFNLSISKVKRYRRWVPTEPTVEFCNRTAARSHMVCSWNGNVVTATIGLSWRKGIFEFRCVSRSEQETTGAHGGHRIGACFQNSTFDACKGVKGIVADGKLTGLGNPCHIRVEAFAAPYYVYHPNPTTAGWLCSW
jgi:hypothetical protein